MNTTTTPGAPTIVSQIESFALFALVILALASFEQTHRISVYLIGFIALVIVIKYGANIAQKVS